MSMPLVSSHAIVRSILLAFCCCVLPGVFVNPSELSAATMSNDSSTYSITAQVVGSGTISPAGVVSVSGGASRTYAISPSAGYSIQSVVVDNVPVTPVPTTYTFSNVMANHTIVANFAIKSYQIGAAVTGGNGTISTPGVVLVNAGQSRTYTITPAMGSYIAAVTVDNVPVIPVPTTYTFSNVTANHNINAAFAVSNYQITATVIAGSGTISPSSMGISAGGSRTYTITPASGYAIQTVTVDNVPVGPVPTTYTFSNVTVNHSINAAFVPITYQITAAVTAGNGTISSPGVVAINAGGSRTYTITPASGFSIQAVTVDNVPVIPATTTYTFSNVTVNHSINAAFVPITYQITTAVTAGIGTISSPGVGAINAGGSRTYTITPASGFSIQAVTVDNVPVIPAPTTYTFSKVTVNHSINAAFVPITYQITAAVVVVAGGGLVNGTISPLGVVSINGGGSQTFTITPNPFSVILAVLVDNVQVNPVPTTYTFSNVTANHTITARFGPP
jgi:hypothetical protein